MHADQDRFANAAKPDPFTTSLKIQDSRWKSSPRLSEMLLCLPLRVKASRHFFRAIVGAIVILIVNNAIRAAARPNVQTNVKPLDFAWLGPARLGIWKRGWNSPYWPLVCCYVVWHLAFLLSQVTFFQAGPFVQCKTLPLGAGEFPVNLFRASSTSGSPPQHRRCDIAVANISTRIATPLGEWRLVKLQNAVLPQHGGPPLSAVGAE